MRECTALVLELAVAIDEHVLAGDIPCGVWVYVHLPLMGSEI